MSDPAKSPEEIEDVLASIRRLVSDHPGDNAPETQAAAADPVPQAAANDDAERLVLTPSFRVHEAGDPWMAVDAEPEDTGDVDDLVADVLDAEAADEAEGAEAADTDEAEADWHPEDRLAQFDDVGGAVDDAAPEDVAEMEAEPNDDQADTTERMDAEVADAEVIDESSSPLDVAEAILGSEEPSEEDLADLHALDGSSDFDVAEDFESETGDDNWPGEGAEAALMTLAARREQGNADDEAPEASDAEEAADADMDMAESAAEVAEDEDTEAPAAPIFSRRHQRDEARERVLDEDDPVEEDVSDTVQADDTATAEPAEEAVDADAEDLGEEPQPFTFPDEEDGILDEETLREIIVDVVREELQGVLGQRITRNVRKMVRREIRLALAAEELE